MNYKYKNNTKSPVIYTACFALFAVVFTLCVALVSLFSFSLQSKNDSFLTLADNDEKFTIIIDAGHGGEDGGAVSESGICEKNINLDISKKLYGLLMFTDFDVVMTRDSDILLYKQGQEGRKKYYDITNRINIASSYDNALLISVHQNKFPIRKYYGFQVYYSKNNENSEIFANIIKNNVKTYLQPQNKREIKAADENIRLLDSVHIPAVLAECGFLSNETEAALLNTEDYRNKIAYLLYVSIIEYVSNI